MKKILATLALIALALPASAAWKLTGTAPNEVFHLFYCAAPERISEVDDAQRWKYRNAPVTARVILEDWARTAVVSGAPDCGPGRDAIVLSMPRARAEEILDDYDLDGAETLVEKADAFDDEVRDQLLADEADYKQFLAEQAAVPDPVGDLEDE